MILDLMQNLIGSLDTWMAASTTNYATYFIVMALIIGVSGVVMFVFRRLMGKTDERTEKIDLQISYVALFTGVVAMLLYIMGLTQKIQYIQQLSLVPLALMLVTSAIATVVKYRSSR